MDIDCDGTQNGAGDDGRCGSSGDTQDITAFQYTVAGYNAGINDLNAYVHPYVVFGNSRGKKTSWPKYAPQDDGVKPLSVMAVVCGDQLVGLTSPLPFYESNLIPLSSSVDRLNHAAVDCG
jgi:hypothetical protein